MSPADMARWAHTHKIPLRPAEEQATTPSSAPASKPAASLPSYVTL